MEIVLIHGFFLKGTGSNLFVKNVCRELCKAGHRVRLVCQEDHPEEIDFVSEAYAFDSTNTICTMTHSKETDYPGKCLLYRPNLNGFLPVFVYDNYEGYTVKEFKDCTREEIEQYLDCNVNALNYLAENRKTDLLWTNHTIMQPVYAGRSKLMGSGCKHLLTVHGSCLNFAVRENELLQKYAWEAISYADKVVFVSQFSKTEFLDYFRHNPLLEEKAIVIPGGVDPDKFAPLAENETRKERIDLLLGELTDQRKKTLLENAENSWKTDDDIVEKLATIDFEKEKIILYYGKYLWTKGIQILIAAMPLIMMRQEDVRLVLVGYGSSRAYLEAMVEALSEGRRDEYLKLLKHPERFQIGIEPAAAAFIKGLAKKLETEKGFAEDYFSAAKGKIGSALVFTGLLGHDHLKTLIACSDITVAASVVPEAFGLVGLEALSAGIIPVQTNHSGYAEVIEKYVSEFSDVIDKTKMHPLYLDENLVMNMADNICTLLDSYKLMDQKQRNVIRQRARKISVDNYSWESIVKRYLYPSCKCYNINIKQEELEKCMTRLSTP